MRLLEYIPGTLRVLRLLASEPEEFAAAYGVRLHEVAQSVAQTSYEFLKEFPYERRPEFLGYLVVEGESQEMVGTCSFQGPPEEGAVGIAFYTFPGFEGRGIATEMARFLVERAREDERVTVVVAETPPDAGAAARVLEKIGMRFAGGRWEMPLR